MGKRAGELSVRLLECGSGLRFLGRKLHRVQLPFGRNLSHVRFNDRVRVQTNGSETQLFSQTNALRPRIVRMGADDDCKMSRCSRSGLRRSERCGLRAGHSTACEVGERGARARHLRDVYLGPLTLHTLRTLREAIFGARASALT